MIPTLMIRIFNGKVHFFKDFEKKLLGGLLSEAFLQTETYNSQVCSVGNHFNVYNNVTGFPFKKR